MSWLFGKTAAGADEPDEVVDYSPDDNTPLIDTISRSFGEVPIDRANNNAISTTEFLKAAKALSKLFDSIGMGLDRGKEDMINNIKKARRRQKAAPGESASLQSLILGELKAKEKTASGGLVWLVRTLDFIAQALHHSLDNPNAKLSESFSISYGNTLEPKHIIVVKPLFRAGIMAMPYRKNFYEKIGNTDEKRNDDLRKALGPVEEQVKIFKDFQASQKEIKDL